jgi:hypothetical protein
MWTTVTTVSLAILYAAVPAAQVTKASTAYGIKGSTAKKTVTKGVSASVNGSLLMIKKTL